MSVTFLTNEDKTVLEQSITQLSEEIETLKNNSGDGSDTPGITREMLAFDSYYGAAKYETGEFTKTTAVQPRHLKKVSTLPGGRLYFDWDTNKVTNFIMAVYLYDENEQCVGIFCDLTGTGKDNPCIDHYEGDLGMDAWMPYNPTANMRCAYGIRKPFSLPVPAGHTVLSAIRMEGGVEFPDGTLDNSTVAEWATTGVTATLVYDESGANLVKSEIAERNEDVLPLIQSAARYGYNGNGAFNVSKQLTILATTDIHRSTNRYQEALNYMDFMPLIDFGICLGDMQGGNFVENDGTWFVKPINAALKKFFPVIGNHDAGNSNSTADSATKSEQFAKFFAPVLARLGLTGLSKTYYSVNTDYGVTMIVLDCHDVPDTKTDATTFAVSRKVIGYSQEQVDWLISTLAAVPVGNHVIVAVHNMLDPATMVEGAWTQTGHMNEGHGNDTGDYPDMIPAIIDAWQRGTTLSKTYTPETIVAQPTLTVNANFTARGEGVFAGYLRGHSHGDYIAKMTNYPTQNVYCFAATAHDGWQNGTSDLPRVTNDKTEDCITAVAVDKVARKVKLVRIGSNVTFDMVRRDMIAIPY